MNAPTGGGRDNQRRRTRKALLEAAARLMQAGRPPSLEEVADEALVSRATAYRYFPGVEALLLEASLDVALPEPAAVFAGASADDPVERLERVDAAFEDMMRDNEAPLRMMLAQSLERRAREGGAAGTVRQNRRGPLIEAALAPARRGLRAAELAKLRHALALVIGAEAMVVFKDVLQLGEAEARDVRRFAIRALVEAARTKG